MARSPQDVYARYLVSGRGYPLWTPEPNMNLPDVYVREGLKIGDVGVVVPEDGSFDVFFNVCLPLTHSLHRETGVPNNFTPILLSGRDIAKFPEAERAGRIISTSSVTRVRNTDAPDEDPERCNTVSPRAQPEPLNYEFRLSSKEGAILILPEGAERYYLRNERLFLDEAIQHAVDWYTFAEQRLGRIISNDALYLITGFYKTRSWSLAAYQQGTDTNYAQFRAAQVGSGNVTASYTWATTQAMDWRAGPSEQYYNGIPNQTVFIQGFKIAVREGLLRTKRVNVKADFPSVRPARVEFSSGSWFAKLGSRASGTSSSSTADTSKGTNTSLNMDTIESDLLGNESDEAQDDITIHCFPQVSNLKPVHPSDLINQYLLREDPSASIAITHDGQWSVLLEKGLLKPEEASQEDCLITAISSNYTLTSHEGAVYLQSTTKDNGFDGHAITALMSSEQRSEIISYAPPSPSHVRRTLPGASDPPSYMARPQADADVSLKYRQRSNVTAFSSFTTGWRRSRLEAVSTTAPQAQPQELAFDTLVEALSPPAVPSLAHAHALASMITTQSPLPKAAVLNPLLGSLCSVDSPPQLQCAGYEIMASYWEIYEGKVATSDKLAHSWLLLHTSWSPETGDSHLRALRALTKEGSEAFGIEMPLLNILKSWIKGAFEAYLSCDPSDRGDRERSVELLAAFVSSILEHPENVARISEGDLSSILQFYASMVSKTLNIPLTFSTSDTTAITSSNGLTEQSAATKVAFNKHRRHSLVSVRSLPPSAIHPSRHPAELMATIYLDHLHSQLKSLAPKTLTPTLPLLFRVQAFLASPLPRLSLMNSGPRGPVSLEERIQTMLHSFFSGPYGTSCIMIFEGHLSPTDQPLNSHGLLISFGAHRTLRFNIRQALRSRMARAYITKLSTHTYTPSGAPSHMDLEKDLMERAWPKDDLSGWDLLKLGRMLRRSIEAWASVGSDEATRVDRDRILDEVASTLKDIFQEFDDREDREDMDEEEASIAGETLRHLVSFVRPLKNTDDAPMIIPLSQPTDAPTPFLRTLTSLLARDHSTYMNPSLSTTLLSIADHLTDTDTAKLLAVMLEQHDLSPASPDWLRNWENILLNATIFGPTCPLTRLVVMKALETTYDSLKDMHSYRVDLAELVFKFYQKEANDSLNSSANNIVMGRILADEAVLRTVSRCTSPVDGSSSPSPYTSTREIVGLLKKVALDSFVEDDDDTASINTSETLCPSPFVAFSGDTPNVASPVLSRRQSGYRSISIRDSGLPSVMSLLSTLTGSRSQSQHSQEQPDNPPPPLVSSASPEPTFTPASLAVVLLVAVFSQLTFTPHSLTQENIDFSISVFLTIVQMVTDAKCPRARILALQFLMRLRADCDHRIYFVEACHDSDGLTANLASLIGRGPESVHQAEREQSTDALQEDLLSRRLLGVQERDGRRSSRGRRVRTSQSTASTSRSKVPLPVSPQSVTIGVEWRDALWSLPETLPFIMIDADTPSEGIVSYDLAQESPCVIPIDAYLLGVLEILEKETNWDILSYVLCHLPVQLSNKHLFCGPKCRVLIARLLTIICSGVTVGDLGSSIERWPPGLKTRDVQGLAYHTLSVLISYRRCFEFPLRHVLVDVLREGLNGQPSTVICCLHALTLSTFELTSSVERSLPPLLEKLSQIMSNSDMAVHILSFLSIVGSIPELHANLREEDFKMVFGVALQCLQHHNRPGTTPTISWAMSQYVRMVSFYVVYVWFLAVRLPDRPRHIRYITRQLLLANEGGSEVDEPTEACFDWLARYTYASADPRPANSVLNDIVMNPTAANHSSSEPAIGEKSWLMGNAIVTIRTLARLGWIEVISRRPSGSTKFICKLENVPLVGPGEVDPDMVSLPPGLPMEGEATKAEQPNPSEETQRAAGGSSVRDSLFDLRRGFSHVHEQEIQDLFSPPTEPPSLPAPGPTTGYAWSKTASQRRNQVMVDPSFLPLQLSPYPNAPTHRRIIDDSALPALFRNLDRIPVIDTHKVGIMYVAPGQTHELEILRNTYGSPAYTRFLEGLGRLINLRGKVDIYAGGLNPDEDGKYAYAWWDDIGQILFHTATMMPNAADDKYCVNKKRHIGNDYVRIVWNDGGMPYKFDTLATQFQFLNIVIESHSSGSIAAFSNSGSTAAAPVADVTLSPLQPPLPTPSGEGKGTTTPPHEAENEYFKVTVQRARGMKEFAPVGCFKLISAEKLPLLVRQLTLLGDWYANVFERTDRDETEVEVISNWRQRLQVVKRFMKSMEGSSGGVDGIGGSREGGEGVTGQEGSRNFTTAY